MRFRDEAAKRQEMDASNSRHTRDEESPSYDLTPLFTLLVRQPPKDHDFRTCPICQRYGITEI